MIAVFLRHQMEIKMERNQQFLHLKPKKIQRKKLQKVQTTLKTIAKEVQGNHCLSKNMFNSTNLIGISHLNTLKTLGIYRLRWNRVHTWALWIASTHFILKGLHLFSFFSIFQEHYLIR